MSEPLIVVVEDDATIAELIEYNLRSDGYATRAFGDGASLFAALPQLPAIALLVLDVMLPGMDGFEILRRLQTAPATSSIPVLMLTARSTETDKVRGLTAGADDYLAKPFGIREFLARVSAILRRCRREAAFQSAGAAGQPTRIPATASAVRSAVSAFSEASAQPASASAAAAGQLAAAAGAAGQSAGIPAASGQSIVSPARAGHPDHDGIIRFGPVLIDDARHRIYRDGQEVEMTHREYELLKYLMLHRGIAYSRDELLSAVWGYDYVGETRTVDVHIRQLRRKLETDDANPILIETVRGRGYRFTDRTDAAPSEDSPDQPARTGS